MTESDETSPQVKAHIAPWLPVNDGPRAFAYYQAAFGALERYRLEDETGRLMVAQLAIGEADFWLQDDPESVSSSSAEPIRMILTVDDPESVHRRALAAGAIEVSPVSEGHGWLIGRLVDPFGHQWEVGKPLEHSE